MDSDLAESVAALKDIFGRRGIPATFGKAEPAQVEELRKTLRNPSRYRASSWRPTPSSGDGHAGRARADLVEHDEWIVCGRLLHGLDNSSRHRADVSAAMTANLSFVVNAAERNLTNFRSRARAIERPSEVLPTPGGPTRQRIGPFGFSFSLRTASASMIRSLTSRDRSDLR